MGGGRGEKGEMSGGPCCLASDEAVRVYPVISNGAGCLAMRSITQASENWRTVPAREAFSRDTTCDPGSQAVSRRREWGARLTDSCEWLCEAGP